MYNQIFIVLTMEMSNFLNMSLSISFINYYISSILNKKMNIPD